MTSALKPQKNQWSLNKKDFKQIENDAPNGELLIPLAKRRLLKVDPEGHVITILHKDTALSPVELKITITNEGPILIFDKLDVLMKTEGDLSLQCKNYIVHAQESVDITSKKTLKLNSESSIITDGVEQHHRASRGDFEIRANDDVEVVGERIRLNSPKLSSTKQTSSL